MTEGTAALVRLAAVLSCGDAEGLADTRAAAARVAPRAEIEEVLLQGFLFLGYPATLRALALWRAQAGGPAASVAPADERRADWRARGEQVCRQVYGDAYERLRHNVAALHPDLDRWMLEEGYGKVLGRPGLGLRERELCIVALLAGMPAAARQLHSHLRGALNVGATPEEVEGALTLAAEVLPAADVEAARALWQGVRARWLERTRAEGGV